MTLRELKQFIRTGEFDAVRSAIDASPELIHTSDPDPDQWDEKTALHCAAKFTHLDIVKLLVDRGAEVYSNPMNSYPPVFVANGFKHRPLGKRPDGQRVLDYFLHEIPDKADGTWGLGATINIAAREGWTDVVRRHIERDPLSVHQRGWIGDVPLHWASHNGHAEIVTMLLDAGAEIEADEINCYGGKPLHWASEHEPHIVKLLLERGANPNSVNRLEKSDFFGVTPLLMNALMTDDCAEVTELLLAAGADLAIRFKGKTALEIAAEKKNTRIQAVLAAHHG
jgi:ankyrin repeat protein